MIIIFFVLIAVGLAAYVFSLQRKIRSSEKENLEEKDDKIVSNFTNQIQLLANNFNASLNNLQKSVDQRLGENTGRLDNAARSYGEVQKQIVHLQEEVKRVHEVGKNISSLQDILKAPKLRGVMGEFLLENLLSQIFSHEYYTLQHAFKSGEKVDAAVQLKDYFIPIDSKFPLENFRKGSDSENEAEKEQYSKLFYQDVKKHVDSIAKKYILPDEGTVDFALMYIPAENVYHEILSNEFGGMKLFDYATGKRVIPVSPNTLYAYLSTIIMGLKGMKIEENAKLILENLKRLEIDFGKVRSDFILIGTHLNNAKKKYDDTEKRIDRFDSRLEKSGVKELEAESNNLIK
ncbi:MAG: DNA recombination protein RmuC [Candidatus Moranbacteria bacterium]|nr:DNA recombination protein RmuC [Candidatus Moranbacteria bacterium]